jgi:PAS domain S-box-containing protein
MRSADNRTKAELLDEIEQLRSRLEEAEQTLQAIRSGEVDALVVEGPQGDRVFSLTGAEHIYRVIAETMHEAALNVDLGGTILFCNQRFSDLMKTPMNEAIGRRVTSFVSRPQVQPLEKLLAEVQSGPVQRRLTLRASDGALVPVQLAASLISEDSSTSICLVASDLTEIEASAKSIRILREHQQAVEESEHRFRAIFESSRDAFVIADDEAVCVQANPTAENIFGLPPEQMLGRRISEFVSSGFENQSDWQAYLTSGVFKGETLFTGRDGRVHHIDCNGVANIMESRHLFVIRDITERKKAEEELRQSREWLRVTLESIGDAVMAVDTDARITFLNPVAGSLTGWQPEEALYQPVEKVFRIINETTRKPAEDIVHKVLVEGRNADLANHTALIHRDGREIPIEDSAAPIRDNSGNLSGMVLVFRDVTEERRSREALHKAHQELEIRVRERTAELRTTISRLEQINQELQEFAHVASHDLQEPLRKIQTFCDLAKRTCGPVLDSTGQEYLDRVFHSADRMRRLLRDLLQFSRVALKPEPFRRVDLGRIVREAADVFEKTVKDAGSRIEIGEMPVLEADESQMIRLFQNLIGNALKFRSDQPPRIHIHTEKAESMFEIRVKDNGIGFEPQYAELVFKPFQRLHSHSEYEGTGMGLSICRKIVERHGGNIRAESEPGKGSTFIIRLPAKQITLEDK